MIMHPVINRTKFAHYEDDLRINAEAIFSNRAQILSDSQVDSIILATYAASGFESALLSVYEYVATKHSKILADAVMSAHSALAITSTYYGLRASLECEQHRRHLRLDSLIEHTLKHEDYHIICLALAICNNSQRATRAHAGQLRKAKVSDEIIHEVLRATSVIKAVATKRQPI